MTTLILVLYLATGAVLREPATWQDCRELLALARYADATGASMSRDGAGRIVRIDCGEETVVLALPSSTGPCEQEPTS